MPPAATATSFLSIRLPVTLTMRLPYAPILLTSCALAIPLAASPEAQTGDMDGLKSMGYSKYSPYYSYGPYGSAVEAEAAKQEKREPYPLSLALFS